MPIYTKDKNGKAGLRITESEASKIAGREVSAQESNAIKTTKDAMFLWVNNNNAEVSQAINDKVFIDAIDKLSAESKHAK